MPSSPRALGLLLVAAATVARLVLAASWGVLADEAYYTSWSTEPAWAYFDHPPLLAWLLALVPHTELGIRAPGIALTALGSALLVDRARDPVLLAALLSVLPPLWLFGTLATPDAPLLGLWMIAIAAVQRGWHLTAGWLAMVAVLAKHTGLALPALLLLGDSTLRRSPRFAAGLALGGLTLLPHGLALLAGGGGALGFQLDHGLGGALRLGGPVAMVAQQLGVSGIVLGIAAIAWLVRGPGEAAHQRLAWALCAPLFGFFFLAALFGPPEANWPAPAWVGVALGLSSASGRLSFAARTGVWVAGGLSVLLCAQVRGPVVPLRDDPGVRPHVGEALSRTVAKHVLPVGVAPGSPSAAEHVVLTERYQEAAWLRWHLGVHAAVWPQCGRRSQLDEWVQGARFFVRPATSGPLECVGDAWRVGARYRFEEHDRAGRSVGVWDVFEIEAVAGE